MGVRVTDWRCSGADCGKELAAIADVRSGWVQRKCRKCGRIAHVGDARGSEAGIDLRCTPFGLHKLAEASAGWRGSVTLRCDRCKTESTITPASRAA